MKTKLLLFYTLLVAAIFTCTKQAQATTPTLKLPFSPITASVVSLAEGGAAQYYATLAGVPIGYDVNSGVYDSWCVMPSIPIKDSILYSATLASPYSSSFSLPLPSDLPSAGWNAVNYLINHKSDYYASGASNWDVQYAIWLILYTSGDFDWTDTSAIIAADVLNKGSSFIPVAGQKIAIVLDFDKPNSEVPSTQDLIVEVNVPTQPPVTGTISGNVYADLNNDGVFNAGDSGLAGVKVTLSGTDSQNHSVSLTTNTSANGSYSFTVPAGTYTITETQPSGYLNNTNTAGSLGGTVTGDIISHIVVAAAAVGTGYNFGELPPATISGFNYIDANNDGIFEGSETPIIATTITLSGTNDQNITIYQTTATDGSGEYVFSNLRPGLYSVTETQNQNPPYTWLLQGKNTVGLTNNTPDGTLVIPDQITQITLLPGSVGTNFNFGELPPASISGFTYIDANNNGLFDGGETPLPGIALVLSGTDYTGHAVSQTTATLADGSYIFTNLPPSDLNGYTVTETPATAPASPLLVLGKNTPGAAGGSAGMNFLSAIPLASGGSDAQYNFAELPLPMAGQPVGAAVCAGYPAQLSVTASVHGTPSYQWRKGTATVVDAGDITGSKSATLKFSAATAADAGSYNVVITDDYGTVTSQSAALAVNPLPTLQLSKTDVTCHGSANGSITTVVDDASDAISVDGSNVHLTGTGSQTFPNLPPDNYTITVTSRAGCSTSQTVTITEPSQLIITLVSTSNASCYGANDGSITVGTTGGTGNVRFTINGTAWNSNIFPALAKGGYNIVAIDDNGCQSATLAVNIDQPSALALQLTPTDASCSITDGSVSAQFSGGTPPYTLLLNGVAYPNVTSPYRFAGLGAGAYTVALTDLRACTVASQNVTLREICPPGVISGNVYADLDDNGILSAGDANLSGVKIQLTGTDYHGNPVSQSTTTATDGSYTFSVPVGTYSITETQPAGYLNNTNTVGSLGGVIAGDTISGITVTASAAGTGYNFGEMPVASIAGFNYIDADNNGVFATGEHPIVGTLITLLGTNDQNVVINQTMNTDASGAYNFGGLRPGIYTVTETQNQNPPYTWLLQGKNTVGLTNNTPDGILGAPDQITKITLLPGSLGTNFNFGELPPASISGFAYVDDNNNGIFDSGEIPLSGIVIQLTGNDYANNPVSLTTTTTADGSYIFTNLPPSDLNGYTVGETSATAPVKPLYVLGKNTAGNLGGATNLTFIGTILLPAGGIGAAYNFGELPLPTASVDGQTVCSGSPVTLTATASGHDTLSYQWWKGASIVTGATGATLPFNSAAVTDAGSYTVVVTDAYGSIASAPATLTVNPTPTITVTMTPVQCNGSANGSVNVVVDDPTAAISLDGGAVHLAGTGSQLFSNLSPNTYTVTAKSPAGCVITQAVTVTEPDPLVLQVVSKNDISCHGAEDGSIVVSATGGQGNITFTINGTAWNSTTFPITQAGGYTIIATDENGCSKDVSVNINEPAALVLGVSSTDAGCNVNNGTLTAAIGGGTAPYNLIINGTTTTVTTASSRTFTGLAPNTYAITLTDKNGCTVPQTVVIKGYCPLVLSCPLNAARVGVTYSSSLMVSGGISPYTFAISAGALPSGLNLDPNTGAITGMPTSAGTFAFTASVTDAQGTTVSASCSSGCTANATWDFASSLGLLGTSHVYSNSSITITAYGFTNVNTPLALYAKNGGTNEVGLGLVGTSDHEIGTNEYVQLDLTSLIASNAQNPTLVINSVQCNEKYNIYGSQTLGTLGTLIMTNATVGSKPFAIPQYKKYNYIAVRSVCGDVLLTSLSADVPTTGCVISVAPAAVTLCLTGPTPTGQVCVSYSSALKVNGGTAPYSFAILSGTLPPGLTLNVNNGSITGKPTTAGAYTFVAQVTDSLGNKVSGTFTITIGTCPLSVGCLSSTCGTVGLGFSSSIPASGGVPGYTFSISTGVLPPGLTLNPTTGIVSGTPTTPGTYPITIKVTDTASQAATANCSIRIAPQPLGIGCVAVKTAQVGVSYSSGFSATGGTAPYTYSISCGMLPSGLSLNPATGAVTGTPTRACTYSFTAKVTDSTPGTHLVATVVCCIRVSPAPLTIGCLATTTAQLGTCFSSAFVTSGGASSLSFSLISGSLPPGLTLNSCSGVISGTPTAAGIYPFTVKVKDSSCATATVSCTIAVTAIPCGLAANPCATSIKLTWNAVNTCAPVTYTIARSTTSGGPYTVLQSGLTTTCFTDTTVSAGVTYYYVVASTIGGATSPYSGQVRASIGNLPSPWMTTDVGCVGAAGSAAYANSIFTLGGSGADIWGTADAFRYVYQTSSGDCSIVAKVTTIQNTSPWAKAGLTIRESATCAGAEHASVFITPGNGVAFQWRSCTGSGSCNANLTGIQAPCWLKIVRRSNSFSAYYSTDPSCADSSWRQIGSTQCISMSSCATIGMAVTSHSDGTVCTASFSGVCANP